MNNAVKILAFAGSARKNSINKILVCEAARIAEKQGALVTVANLADFPADIYHGDDEEKKGVPETMRKFKTLLASHNAFLIATPDYNGGITPLLLNVFSWASRPEGDEEPKSVFASKPVATLAASPGELGGIRAISRLRETLADLDCMVIPGFTTVGNAYEAFNDQGQLKSVQTRDIMSNMIVKLIAIAKQAL